MKLLLYMLRSASITDNYNFIIDSLQNMVYLKYEKEKNNH